MLRKIARSVRDRISPRHYGTEYRDRPAFEGKRSYVFLCGCGRSGTTALVQLVNRHPDVAIGNERFAFRAIAGTLTPDLFETERFLELLEGDTFYTSLTGDSEHDATYHKYHSARVVGDKVPTLFRNLEQLEVFENAKVVFIVREPFAVAQSFVTRARNKEDSSWATDHDHRAAVAEFNESIAAIQNYVATGKPALVLDYSRLFLHKEGLNELWDFLEVDGASTENLDDLFATAKRAEDERWINAIGSEVSQKANFDHYREVLALCPGATEHLIEVSQ